MDAVTPPAGGSARRVRPTRRGVPARVVLLVVLVALVVAAGVAVAAVRSGPADDAPGRSTAGGAFDSPAAGTGLDLGPGGFVVQASPAGDWVSAHREDPRAAVLAASVADRPSALWLTGEDSFGNLDTAVAAARAADGTATFTLYNIPGRDDGLSDPSGVTAAQYRGFVDRVVGVIGDTRAVVVVEPDALWFVDRQTPPGTSAYAERLGLLGYVVDAFAARAPNAHVYLEAGTSSKSVTPERMAQLLQAAGVARAAGFAVNVSSFGPDAEITAWAQGIRSGLAGLGVAGVHYVVDTARNGTPTWDYTWCNPTGRTVGYLPGATDPTTAAAPGLSANLWIKQPGTSDGDCGLGAGTYGGQFMPDVALAMLP